MPETNCDAAVQDLFDLVEDFQSHVTQLKRLRDDGLFKYLSKPSRNALLQGLLDKSASVEDASKAVFRSVKKVKRERLPEEVADLLIAGMRNEAIAVAPTITGAPSVADDETPEQTDNPTGQTSGD